ncbi:MAG TPA: hypothetical protein VFS00_11855, partial [Polyangiaceae bacterium]|nr:hypothetical protein [Polyangiaceae bacterium]
MRNQEQSPLIISRADCEADDVFTFSAKQSNLGTLQLEVWASDGGSDCTQEPNRNSAAASCWRIKRVSNFSQQLFDIDLRAQDIVRKRQGSPDGGDEKVGTAASCVNDDGESAISYTLDFMVLEGGAIRAQARYTVQADLLGPGAPEVRSVSAGEGRARIRWVPYNGQGFGRYDFFCEEIPAGEVCSEGTSGAGGEAGAAGEAGASGSTGRGGAAGAGQGGGGAAGAGAAGAGASGAGAAGAGA